MAGNVSEQSEQFESTLKAASDAIQKKYQELRDEVKIILQDLKQESRPHITDELLSEVGDVLIKCICSGRSSIPRKAYSKLQKDVENEENFSNVEEDLPQIIDNVSDDTQSTSSEFKNDFILVCLVFDENRQDFLTQFQFSTDDDLEIYFRRIICQCLQNHFDASAPIFRFGPLLILDGTLKIAFAVRCQEGRVNAHSAMLDTLDDLQELYYEPLDNTETESEPYIFRVIESTISHYDVTSAQADLIVDFDIDRILTKRMRSSFQHQLRMAVWGRGVELQQAHFHARFAEEAPVVEVTLHDPGNLPPWVQPGTPLQVWLTNDEGSSVRVIGEILEPMSSQTSSATSETAEIDSSHITFPWAVARFSRRVVIFIWESWLNTLHTFS